MEKILAAEGIDPSGVSLDGIDESLYTPIQGLSSTEHVIQQLSGKGVEDMIHLDDLHEGTIIQNLRVRFDQDIIYTYIGGILVAVNCFKPIPKLYDTPQNFRGKSLSEMPPHVFALAEKAYASLVTSQKNQSFIISGESGAGKTETTKLICRYMALASGNKSKIQQDILDIGIALEAFGNAKTIHNKNSSRFGKFIELQFNDDNVLCGAKIRRYLLEKSRVTVQSPDERNYHVFYYLIEGASEELKDALHLTKKTHKDFHYLHQSGCHFIEGVDDAAEFQTTFNSLTIFTQEQKNDICRVLAGILHLGNIKFVAKDGVAKSIENEETFEIVSNLLGLDKKDFLEALTVYKRLIVGEISKSPIPVGQAIEMQHSLARALYSRLFTFLIEIINTQICQPDITKFIGVLDIFGFENFIVNRMEQFCINFANEQLQDFFNEHIFKVEQAEYLEEDIHVQQVDFTDNKPCINMILDKTQGFFTILDEQSYLPKATGDTFVSKLNEVYPKHQSYQRGKPQERETFRIHHYAGQVVYTATEFLEKNRDVLNPDLVSICTVSKFPLIVELFQEEKLDDSAKTLKKVPAQLAKVDTTKRTKPTATFQFKTSLLSLMTSLSETNPFFIRCIKPNPEQVKEKFVSDFIAKQLSYTGMLETVRIRREGFPVRYKYDDFVKRFILILPPEKRKDIQTDSDRDSTQRLINELQITESDYRFGKSKLFIRDRPASMLETRLAQIQAERLRKLKEEIERKRREEEERKRREEEERRRKEEEERKRREEEERKKREEEERKRREREEQIRKMREEEDRRWKQVEAMHGAQTMAFRTFKLQQREERRLLLEQLKKAADEDRVAVEEARQNRKRELEQKNTMRKKEREEALKALNGSKPAPLKRNLSEIFLSSLPPGYRKSMESMELKEKS